eukprot:1148609-Pelagomonas_calceolata.AAC.3
MLHSVDHLNKQPASKLNKTRRKRGEQPFTDSTMAVSVEAEAALQAVLMAVAMYRAVEAGVAVRAALA